MIVGKKVIDVERLRAVYLKPSALERYCESLIPRYARHLPHILDNQKYLVALAIRKEETLPIKLRKDICETLLKNTVVKGYLHSITEVEDLILSSDIDRLLRNLFKEELTNVP